MILIYNAISVRYDAFDLQMRNHETMCQENIEGEVRKRNPKYREQIRRYYQDRLFGGCTHGTEFLMLIRGYFHKKCCHMDYLIIFQVLCALISSCTYVLVEEKLARLINTGWRHSNFLSSNYL